MGRDNRFFDAIHMFHQIFDLGTILIGQAITCRIGNIHHRRSRLDHSLDNSCQVFIFRTPGILAIKLNILNILFGIFRRSDRPLKNLLTIGVELIFDMRIGSTDTGMYTSTLSELQGLGRHVDISLDRPCQSANRRPSNRFRDFNHTIEIARTRNGETRLNHVDAQLLEGPGNLYLLYRIQLTTWHLLTISQRGVKNK